MGKFITNFDTVNAYNEAAPSFDLPHVSLTKNDNIVHYHPISSLAVGTYLYNNGTTGTTANSNVVGVCVIPDGLLPDRKARFMSVKAITTASTAGSTSENGIIWSSNYSRTVLPKQYTEVPCVGLNEDEGTGVITNQVEHSNDNGYMPSDSENGNFTALTNPYDSVTMFAYDDSDHHIPSPFMNNGAFNENYSTLFTTGGTAINNALSDFDGFRNTQILIKDADVVAAKHCAIFNPGYREGEWYLPAVGELGFIMPRFKVINSKLSALGSSGVQLDGTAYWSSTEYDVGNAWLVYADYGNVYNLAKYDAYRYVRAFLAL
jgi:hypothetical protein